MSAFAIEIEKIVKRYPSPHSAGEDLLAINQLSLSVKAGELLTLLGPSGCGKSTLLFIVAGLEKATEGRVLSNGEPVTGPSRERNVLFQQYALFPWRTVLANVTLGLEGRLDKREVTSRARESLALVGLEGFEHHYPHQLSGGMQQRAALARSLAMRPKVLLMDEPFAAVDAQSRETLQEELLRIWQAERMTVVFVTHSIEEAVYLAERVVVLAPRPGRVKEIVNVPADYPREYAFRTSERASALRRELHDLMRDG